MSIFILWQLFTIGLFILCITYMFLNFSRQNLAKFTFDQILTSNNINNKYPISRYGKYIDKNTAFYRADSDKNSLVVVVLGRAFMSTAPNDDIGFANVLYEQVMDQCHLVVVGYTGRDNCSICDILQSMNDTLSSIKRYDNYHFVALSSGVMISTAFIRKEMNSKYAIPLGVKHLGLNVKSISCICAIFSFENLLDVSLDYQLRKIILGPFKAYGLFDMSSGIVGLPTCVISHKHDFLYEQSRQFIARFNVPNFVANRKLPHLFTRIIGLPETKQAINVLGVFILKNI